VFVYLHSAGVEFGTANYLGVVQYHIVCCL